MRKQFLYGEVSKNAGIDY